VTGIVRLQTGRQHITNGESFRRRTKTALQEIERAAAGCGYDRQDVADTHFAVIAFLDSVVLNSNDPVRAEWERKTLQEELFGGSDAGVVFYEKLEKIFVRRDGEELADVLEVFLICMLLGFEGRYSGALQGELERLIERTGRRIETIRGPMGEISPGGILPAEPMKAAPVEQYSPVARNACLLLALVAVLLYVVLAWNLSTLANTLNSKLA
jgi:type VI secretion system protein ImpK